jgi:hypothetical protein
MAEKLTGSFRARDAAGNAYSLDIFQDFSATGNPGTVTIRMRNRTTVNRLGKGEYQINDYSQTRLWSDDANAP